MIWLRTLPLVFVATVAVCPPARAGETWQSRVQGFVEIYDQWQLPDDVVVVASDSFSDRSRGSAFASHGYRSGSVSAESYGRRMFTSDTIQLELWNSVSYSQQGHYMDIQGQSYNDYRLTFFLTRPSTVRLTGYIDTFGQGAISTDAEIELAGWRVSLGSMGGPLDFDTTLQLGAGRYTFSGTSSAVLSGSQCCSDDEYGSVQLEVAAVFEPGALLVPEATPRAIGPGMALVALLNWRRRIRNPGADIRGNGIASSS